MDPPDPPDEHNTQMHDPCSDHITPLDTIDIDDSDLLEYFDNLSLEKILPVETRLLPHSGLAWMLKMRPKKRILKPSQMHPRVALARREPVGNPASSSLRFPSFTLCESLIPEKRRIADVTPRASNEPIFADPLINLDRHYVPCSPSSRFFSFRCYPCR